MRRYSITVNDRPIVVDVEAVGANLFRVQLDGRLVDVTLDDHRDVAAVPVVGPGVAMRAGRAAAPVSATPAVAAPRSAAPAASPAPAASAPAVRPAPGGGGGRNKLTAPMPGVILTVDVAVGATVSRGDVLMVLEAMKMKNELRAPQDGVVAEIYVADGAQVKFGETLVRFEE